MFVELVSPPSPSARALICVVLAATTGACAAPEPPTRLELGAELPSGVTLEQVDVPAPLNATSFALTPGALAEDAASLTWIEPLGSQSGASAASTVPAGEAERWRLVNSTWEDGWQPAEPIVAHRPLFANWADRPRVVAATRAGTLHALWLERLGEGPYAYGIRTARRALRADPGSWVIDSWLHDDISPVEHGFVSVTRSTTSQETDPRGDELTAFWLDGRGMEDNGPMTLRSSQLGEQGARRPSHLLDERVCECCPTDAASTSKGPIVAYRDRSEAEVRDIAVVRWLGDRWSAPTLVADDGWKINGCPVNGPAIAAAGDLVLVAWFTAATPGARVQVALSQDGGATFAEPLSIDDQRPVGRVDLTLAGGLAWVSWLGRTVDGTALLLRPLSLRVIAGSAEPEGTRPADARLLPGRTRTVALISAARAAGIPQLGTVGDRPVLVWGQIDHESRRSLHSATVSW